MSNDKYMAVLGGDDPFSYLQFALARTIPEWIEADFTMEVLDLGPGRKLIPGTTALDWPDWDGDREGCLEAYEDDSIGGIFASHFLEHLNEPRYVIAEAARVLADGCPFTIFVPHARYGEMYLQDLDHKTPFVLASWKNHLQNPFYSKGKLSNARLEIGLNMTVGIKDENIGILTQLIKRSI